MNAAIRLHDLVAARAATTPHAPAITFRDDTLDYGELHRHAAGFAAALRALGVERGDRVAVFVDKRPETVVAVLATSAAGAVFVPVNPALRARQLGHIVDDCTARVLVTTTDRFAAARDTLRGCKSLETVVLVGAVPADATDERFDVVAWAGLAATATVGTAATDSDLAAILYTSGSTGAPKGVVLSHRNLLVGAASVSSYLGNTASDTILAALPLSFDAGLSQLTTAFAAGAHVVLMNYLLPADVVRLCARHRVTGLTCVPPLWIQLVEQDWPVEATRSMRYLANTGGRMPRATLDRLRAIFPGAAPFLMYGLTEAFRSTYLDPAQVDRRPDSIGRAIPNAEILVVREDGSPCDPGEAGELVHRGPLVAQGYWNDPERTAERFRPVPGRPGELCLPELAVWSGDVVRRDEEGFLYFVGRRDEMIKTSGYRVSPTEIEEVAHGCGPVRDAAAFGVEDDRLGQRIVLVVTGADLDPDALRREFRRCLPSYMVPAEIVVRAELPRSPNGKYDRAALRAELEGTR